MGAYSIPSFDLVYGNLIGEGGFTVLPMYCTTPRIEMWTDEFVGMWASHIYDSCEYHLYNISTPGPGHVIFFNAVTLPPDVTRPEVPRWKDAAR